MVCVYKKIKNSNLLFVISMERDRTSKGVHMKNKSYLRETIECYVGILFILAVFIGAFVLSGYQSGNEWWSMLPDFSWDMINSWSEIMNNGS